MAISFSRPDPASPASVSSAQFPTARRGYDQSEVRDFLRMVAAEQARLQERERFLERELRAAQQSAAPNMATIDEDTATRLLGEEAARVLTTAREAATQIRGRAEEGSARLLREATDEAQRLREEAEIEAARRRQDAAADSEAELQMAKQQGRDMVNEARAYRERVLSELARRRELARQQIEQLIHGRDRLLQAFERARIAAVEVMAELTPLGEPNEYVNLQPTTGPVPIMVPSREPVARVDLTLVPDGFDDMDADDVADDLGPDVDGTVVLSLAPDLVAAADIDHTPEPEPQPADALDVESPDATDVDVDVEVDDAGAEVIAIDTVVDETPADDEPEFFLDDSATPLDTVHAVDDGHEAAETDVAEVVGTDDNDDNDDNVVELFADATDDAVDDPAPAAAEAVTADATTASPGGTVDDLFARLRAARSQPVVASADPLPATAPVAAAAPAAAEPVSEAETEPDPVAEPDPDEAIIPLIVAVARKLKRVLADEQNEVLDTLRRKEPVRSIDVLVPWELDQADRYAAAVERDLVTASVAGALGHADGSNPAIVRPATDAVTNEIVAPLRDRLARCIDKADGNNVELANQVRSLYREWKTHRIDEHVEVIVRLAFDRGALTVTSR